jgi:hypothetical protein
MKNVYLTDDEINKMNPEHICISIVSSPDNIVTINCKEIMRDLNENKISKALERYLIDISRNSFEIIAIQKNFLFKKELVNLYFKPQRLPSGDYYETHYLTPTGRPEHD